MTSTPEVEGRQSTEYVVGVSGASGMVYALDLLRQLRQPSQRVPEESTVVGSGEPGPPARRVHLVVSSGAKRVLPTESGVDMAMLEALADVVHKDADLGAAIASGSFPAGGMAVVPCSAGTLAKIAQGHTDSLLTRAAHVMLKERRPLVLVVREAPYSRPMLVNMLAAFDAGAVILPAWPGFYQRPTTVDDLIGTVTARVLDKLGIDNERSPRWQGSR